MVDYILALDAGQEESASDDYNLWLKEVFDQQSRTSQLNPNIQQGVVDDNLWLKKTNSAISKKLESATKALNNPTRFAKSQGLNALKKWKAKMDSSSFGFAISFSDNAGLFQNKEVMNDVRDGILMLFDDEASTEDIANKYKDAGEMAFAANYYRWAEISFFASQLVFETNAMTRHVNYAGVIADLGLLNHTMGRYSSAETYSNKALDLRKELFSEESMAYAASLNNLAVLYKDQGKYTQAELTMNSAVDLTRELGKQEELLFAIMLNNQAMLYQKLGRMTEAESLLKESIELSENIQGKKSSNHQRLVTNLAILFQEMERYEDSEKLFLEVISQKEKNLGKRHPDYAHMLNNLAALYVLMEKDDEVESLLEKARAIYIRKFGISHPTVATNASHLGNFYRYKNQLDNSESMLKEALNIRTSTLGENHPDVVKSKEDLALLYWQMEEWEKSNALFTESLDQSLNFIENFFPAMSETEKASYWSLIQPRFFRYFAFAIQAQEYVSVTTEVFDYRMATKSILMSSTQKIRSSILNGSDQHLIDEYLEWVDVKESLAAYYSYSKEEISDQKVNLDSLERLANDKERFLSKNSSVFNEGFLSSSHTYSELSTALDDDEALIEIMQIPVYERSFTGVQDYYALIGKSGLSSPELIRLGNSTEFDDKYFKSYKNAIQFKMEDKDSYNKFWLPLEPSVVDKKHLYISKDGIYHQINVNTLKNEDGFVFDRWNIELLTTSNDILDVKARKNESFSKPAILFGDIDYGSKSILELPGTKKEVETIHALLTKSGIASQMYTGLDASESMVKNAEPHSIYHFATHGFFLSDVSSLPKERVFGIQPEIAQEQPMLRAGILFAGAGQTYDGINHKEYSVTDNGVLTAYEALNLPLENTELVVLSACETGLGDVKAGEGVYGLQRAFLVAGTKRLIMSLWKVDDEATQALMSEFYKILTSSNDVRSAFKQSQKKLKSTHPEPYYWGAFVLIER